MNYTKQNGVALFISLVLLLVLTIVGVSSVQTTSLEVRMARNHHDSTLAFQAAESALRDAEILIEGLADTTAFDNAGPLYDVADMNQAPRWEQANVWTGGNSAEAATDMEVAGVTLAAPSRYIVEHAATVIIEENAYQLDDPYAVSTNNRIEMFRITVRGVGGSNNANVTIQSGYGRIMN